VNLPGPRAVTETDAAGFVLAGGRSSRMGTDKALVRLGGQPLMARAVRIFQDAGLVVSVAGGDSALATFAPVVEDRQPGLGPLAGICAALASTSRRWAVFLPVDLPLLPASLAAYLLQQARITGSSVTLPSVNGFAQTFPVVLNRATLPMLERELNSGQRGCFSAFQAAAAGLGEAAAVVPVELLLQAGQIAHPSALPAVHWFLNLNTVENLRRAEALYEAMIA
jgi:molybdopterin-guanine dinucleotide biosynthesis protein A